MRIAVVGGAGAMGRVCVADAARSDGVAEVWIVDRDREAADRARAWSGSARVSVRSGELGDALSGADAVVNAASHRLNVAVMDACLEVGAHYTDLGGLYYWALDQYELDARFAAAGLSAAISVGAAPGITNMLAAACAEALETVEEIELVDATIPGREWSPAEPWSPPYAAGTLIDEFTEPAPVFLEGRVELRPAGSGGKVYSFPEGEVECVYTIHSEPATLPRSYADRGIRRVEWRLGLPPADSVRLRSFVASGLASNDPVDVAGVAVVPRDVLVATLARQETAPSDRDAVERLRAIVVGTTGGRRVELVAEVLVRPPSTLDVDQGAFATGVPPSIAAQMLARGQATRSGVGGPEVILPVDVFFRELAARGLELQLSEARPIVAHS